MKRYLPLLAILGTAGFSVGCHRPMYSNPYQQPVYAQPVQQPMQVMQPQMMYQPQQCQPCAPVCQPCN